MQNIEEAYAELWKDIKRDSYAFGQPQPESFFNIYAEIAAGNGDCLDLTYTPVKKEGTTGYQVDGYALDTERGELYLAIVDLRDDEEIAPLNQSQVNSLYGRVERFYKNAIKPGYINTIEETSPTFQVAYPIFSDNALFKRVRVIIFSNARLASRKKTVDSREIAGKKFIYNILDFSRYIDILKSMGSPEPIEIDLEEEFQTTLPCLKVHTGSTEYASYLVVMPGCLLSRIYEIYGARLLEQNVRTFLQAKTKVNQAIITTIEKYPQMFFAYNNGLTATASGVTTKELAGGTTIKAINNLQIVNGGQTTASILYARDNKKANLDNVFVQMKLSVISEERVDETVPKISRYANSQNKISDADFFSTHPFHVEMEKISRRLSAPQKENAFTASKWFYERARGQYKNMFAYGKISDKRKFETEFPSDQVITKTDFAKYALTFECLPHLVSQGAQKCFMHFADMIGKDWEENSNSYNDGYFKDVIAKVIVFRWTDKMVAQSVWYRDDRGYKAQIVTYTIAWLVNHLKAGGNFYLDLQQIWNKQTLCDGLKAALENLAPQVYLKIKDAPPNVKNLGEYCKKQACWAAVSSLKVELPGSLKTALIHADQLKLIKKESLAVKKMTNEIEFETRLLELMPAMNEIMEFARSRRLLSPKSHAALSKINSGNIIISASEKNTLEFLFKRMNEMGYEFNV
ncbi:AIPR family protein [Desulfomicrobium salsuginis]